MTLSDHGTSVGWSGPASPSVRAELAAQAAAAESRRARLRACVERQPGLTPAEYARLQGPRELVDPWVRAGEELADRGRLVLAWGRCYLPGAVPAAPPAESSPSAPATDLADEIAHRLAAEPGPWSIGRLAALHGRDRSEIRAALDRLQAQAAVRQVLQGREHLWVSTLPRPVAVPVPASEPEPVPEPQPPVPEVSPMVTPAAALTPLQVLAARIPRSTRTPSFSDETLLVVAEELARAPQTRVQIAESLGRSRSMMTTVVRALVAAGLAADLHTGQVEATPALREILGAPAPEPAPEQGAPEAGRVLPAPGAPSVQAPAEPTSPPPVRSLSWPEALAALGLEIPPFPEGEAPGDDCEGDGMAALSGWAKQLQDQINEIARLRSEIRAAWATLGPLPSPATLGLPPGPDLPAAILLALESARRALPLADAGETASLRARVAELERSITEFSKAAGDLVAARDDAAERADDLERQIRERAARVAALEKLRDDAAAAMLALQQANTEHALGVERARDAARAGLELVRQAIPAELLPANPTAAEMATAIGLRIAVADTDAREKTELESRLQARFEELRAARIEIAEARAALDLAPGASLLSAILAIRGAATQEPRWVATAPGSWDLQVLRPVSVAEVDRVESGFEWICSEASGREPTLERAQRRAGQVLADGEGA